MAADRRDSRGFTLVEMLVVIGIIAVLTAVIIPVIGGQQARAKAAVDMANVRRARAAAVSAYLTAHAGEEKTYYFDAGTGTVTDDRQTAAGFAGYGQSSVEVTGAAGVPMRGGKAQIVAVRIAADGSCTASWGLGSEIDDYLAKAVAAESAAAKKHSGDDLISAMGGLLPVKTSALFGTAGVYGAGDTLYWRPRTVTVDGVRQVFLYAGNSASGNNNWQGYAIYYNGKTYLSTAKNSYSHKTDRNSVMFNSVSGDFGAYLLSTGRWAEKTP